jgi:hypothetical protein
MQTDRPLRHVMVVAKLPGGISRFQILRLVKFTGHSATTSIFSAARGEQCVTPHMQRTRMQRNYLGTSMGLDAPHSSSRHWRHMGCLVLCIRLFVRRFLFPCFNLRVINGLWSEGNPPLAFSSRSNLDAPREAAPSNRITMACPALLRIQLKPPRTAATN